MKESRLSCLLACGLVCRIFPAQEVNTRTDDNKWNIKQQTSPVTWWLRRHVLTWIHYLMSLWIHYYNCTMHNWKVGSTALHAKPPRGTRRNNATYLLLVYSRTRVPLKVFID